MKILYKPFGIIAGVIGSKLGQSIFKTVWSKLDSAEPPSPTTKDIPLPKVIGATALEAATMAAVGAAVDRAGVSTFYYLTGIWAGETRAELEEKTQD